METAIFNDGEIIYYSPPDGNIAYEVKRFGTKCKSHYYMNRMWYDPPRRVEFTGSIGYDSEDKQGPGIWTGTSKNL